MHKQIHIWGNLHENKVKIRISEKVCGRVVEAPCFMCLGISWKWVVILTSWALYSHPPHRRKGSQYSLIRSWMGPNADPMFMAKRIQKIDPLLPDCSQLLRWLIYLQYTVFHKLMLDLLTFLFVKFTSKLHLINQRTCIKVTHFPLHNKLRLDLK
jgi:hypothetical protein